MPKSLSAPPLRALQAFSAVARAGSVVGAAEELAVTPSAISHLVRQMERRLGVVLFTRQGRGLTLTLDGERLATAVGPALAVIDDALDGFGARQRLLARVATRSRDGTAGRGVPSLVGSRNRTRAKTIV